MIPVRDVIPARTTPFVTLVLIALNLLVFAVQFTTARMEPAVTDFLFAWGMVPAEFAWRPALTSLFVHAGLAHLGGNVLALWLFGPTVEDRMGHLRFCAFYLATGISAVLVAVWLSPETMTPLVGASGAVAAVAGAHLALFPHSKVLMLVPSVRTGWDVIEVPAALLAVLWLALQLLGGFAQPLEVRGSLGVLTPLAGLAVGLVLIWILRRPERFRVEWWGT